MVYYLIGTIVLHVCLVYYAKVLIRRPGFLLYVAFNRSYRLYAYVLVCHGIVSSQGGCQCVALQK